MTLERRFLGAVHFRLPFAAAFDRRLSGFQIQGADVRQGLQLRELPQPPAHDVGVDQPVLGRFHGCLYPALRDGTSARLRFLQTLTSEPIFYCGYQLRNSRIRRAGHRRGRRGLARGHRSVGGRRQSRADLQIAARQGAHRHGRRRHGGGDGQRGRPRQLEGPFRRHDARRPIRQQLAHGRTARQGSAGARSRTRSVGRGVRSHEGRKNFAAQFRRPPLSAPRARRRPHGTGTDPHAAGSRHSSGHHRFHGIHHRLAVERRRARGRRVWLRPRARAFPHFQGEGRGRLHRRTWPRVCA